MQDPSKIPSWLKIVKNYHPDFIIRNPEVRVLSIRTSQWAWFYVFTVAAEMLSTFMFDESSGNVCFSI